MVELAIFGSILLLLFGVLLNFGMNADYTQYAQMKAFRQGLRMSADIERRKATYLHLHDRHLPNPSDPFGIGGTTPSSGQANVTRDFLQYQSPDTVAHLPRTFFAINQSSSGVCPNGEQPPCHFECPSGAATLGSGQRAYGCTTAGFRKELGVPEDTLEKYYEIYGEARVCNKPECGGKENMNCVSIFDEERGETITECELKTYDLVIMDACDGEIINYDGCVRQASMIADPDICYNECEKSKPRDSTKNCRDICDQLAPMCPPRLPNGVGCPWYASNRTRHPSGIGYRFPMLEAVFANINGLGVQQTFRKETVSGNQLQKEERPAAIVNTTRQNWADTTTRDVKYNDILTASDPYSLGRAAQTNKEAPSAVRKGATTTWTTNW